MAEHLKVMSESEMVEQAQNQMVLDADEEIQKTETKEAEVLPPDEGRLPALMMKLDTSLSDLFSERRNETYALAGALTEGNTLIKEARKTAEFQNDQLRKKFEKEGL